jgi:hypothetical protein
MVAISIAMTALMSASFAAAQMRRTIAMSWS